MKISVIIPALNAEKELPGLLKALSEQTLRADEIIVTDSESEDRTRQVAEAEGARVIPVLRKDFMQNTEDIRETAACGASAVLLICASMPEEMNLNPTGTSMHSCPHSFAIRSSRWEVAIFRTTGPRQPRYSSR